MVDLYIVAEGHGEEAFIRQVLAPYLGAHGVFASTHRVTTCDKERRVGGRTERNLQRGGVLTYQHIRDDIRRLSAQHGRRGAWISTLIDLYHLPNDFPEYARGQQLADPYARADALEAAMVADLPGCRVLPYIQVHEFEALLFTDLARLAYLCDDRQRRALDALIASTAGTEPERVNGGENTHPAARIEAVRPRYSKPRDVPNTLKEIGLQTLLARTQRFAAWVRRLESL